VAERRPRSVYDLLARQYGVQVSTAQNPDATSLGTTDAIVARTNPRRVGLTVINLSVNNIYLRPLTPASASAGILLVPQGGSLTVTWQDDLALPALEWHGIADAAGSAIFVQEVLVD